MADDRDALAQLHAVSSRDLPHEISHYLYFPTELAARDAGSELRSLGFGATEDASADGINWLVLAEHQATPSAATIQSTRQLMEAIARRRGGSYDGWEAQVVHPSGKT